jgi:flagellar basal body-associated protein FliL
MSTRRALLGLIAAALLLWSGATALAAEKGQVDPNAPVFIKLQPLNVTVFDRGLTRGKITIELQLDVIKKASAANVQSRLPRLYDGFLAAVTEYSNSRTAVDRAPNLDYLLERFQTITDEAVGAGTAKVLFHAAVRTL